MMNLYNVIDIVTFIRILLYCDLTYESVSEKLNTANVLSEKMNQIPSDRTLIFENESGSKLQKIPEFNLSINKNLTSEEIQRIPF